MCDDGNNAINNDDNDIHNYNNSYSKFDIENNDDDSNDELDDNAKNSDTEIDSTFLSDAIDKEYP